jgi:hypothetical protein
MAKPETKKSAAEIKKEFETWAEGRTGLSKRDLIELYSSFNNLSTEERKGLLAEATKEEAKAKAEQEKKAKVPAAKKITPAEKELVISRTPYPKWWKTLRTAPIVLTNAGIQTVVTGRSDSWIYIATIVLTVSGETNITLTFGSTGSSGPMDFGGDNEPRGMVIAMGESPAPCGPGGFTITSDGEDVSVGGFVTYYLERM